MGLREVERAAWAPRVPGAAAPPAAAAAGSHNRQHASAAGTSLPRASAAAAASDDAPLDPTAEAEAAGAVAAGAEGPARGALALEVGAAGAPHYGRLARCPSPAPHSRRAQAASQRSFDRSRRYVHAAAAAVRAAAAAAVAEAGASLQLVGGRQRRRGRRVQGHGRGTAAHRCHPHSRQRLPYEVERRHASHQLVRTPHALQTSPSLRRPSRGAGADVRWPPTCTRPPS